jgi:hypothetical protein
MTESNDKFEMELKILIDETLDLRMQWEQRRLEAESQVKHLDVKISAYQTSLKDYWEKLDFEEKRKMISVRL